MDILQVEIYPAGIPPLKFGRAGGGVSPRLGSPKWSENGWEIGKMHYCAPGSRQHGGTFSPLPPFQEPSLDTLAQRQNLLIQPNTSYTPASDAIGWQAPSTIAGSHAEKSYTKAFDACMNFDNTPQVLIQGITHHSLRWIRMRCLYPSENYSEQQCSRVRISRYST